MLEDFGAFLLIELVDLSLFNLDEFNEIRIEGEIVEEIVMDKEIEAGIIEISIGILGTDTAGTDTIGSFTFLGVVNCNAIHL